VTYHRRWLQSIWDSVDPYQVKGDEIFDAHTGIMIGQKYSMMKAGSVFGDYGILYNSPRSATVVAIMDSAFAYIDNADYKEVLMEAEKKNMEKKNRFFADKVFKRAEFGMSKDKLSKYFNKRNFSKGSHLFRQGDEPKSIYVIKVGEVRLYCQYQTELKPNVQGNENSH
jgi:CRP-like cAMP-binding protein